jgi:hypothetical protein
MNKKEAVFKVLIKKSMYTITKAQRFLAHKKQVDNIKLIGWKEITVIIDQKKGCF